MPWSPPVTCTGPLWMGDGCSFLQILYFHPTWVPPSTSTVSVFLDTGHIACFRGKRNLGFDSRPLTQTWEESLCVSLGSPKERTWEGTSYSLKYLKHCRGKVKPVQMLSTLSLNKLRNHVECQINVRVVLHLGHLQLVLWAGNKLACRD